MTVMRSMQVEAINRIRLLPLLVCTRIQTSPKHQVPLYSWPQTWRILYSQQPYYYGSWLWAWLPRNGAVNRSISCWRIDSDAATIRSLLPATLTTGYARFCPGCSIDILTTQRVLDLLRWQLAGYYQPSTCQIFHSDSICWLDYQLDYIQGMGFTAIWITPVTKQLPQNTGDGTSYHGYWQQDM